MFKLLAHPCRASVAETDFVGVYVLCIPCDQPADSLAVFLGPSAPVRRSDVPTYRHPIPPSQLSSTSPLSSHPPFKLASLPSRRCRSGRDARSASPAKHTPNAIRIVPCAYRYLPASEIGTGGPRRCRRSTSSSSSDTGEGAF